MSSNHAPMAGRTARKSPTSPTVPADDRRYAIDARKIELELGWKPSETFESGIRKTVQWYLENPAWVAHVQNGSYREWVAQQYGQGAPASSA